MDPSSLALRFNEVSTALRPLGHRVIVRRARELLGQGRFDDTIVFLSESARRLSIRELAGLANDVRSWVHARGDMSDLLEQQSWIVGSEIDDLISTSVEDEFTAFGALGLAETSAQRELQATKPVEALPSRKASPSPPPTPTEDLASEPQRSSEREVSIVERAMPTSAARDTSGLPTSPLIAGVMMLLVLTVWFCFFWPL